MEEKANSKISRRNFVRTASLATAAVTTGIGITHAKKSESLIDTKKFPLESSTSFSKDAFIPMIGFQAEIDFILEYGVERFCDDIQSSAQVNTLIIFAHTFQASWDGLDRSTNPKGNFAAANPQYYKNVYMKPNGLGTSDFNLPEAMQKIITETKRREIKIIPWILEDNRAPLEIIGMDKLYEIDLYGRRTGGHPGGPCLNNPYFRNLLSGRVVDWIRSYDVDGLQRGTERQGPLGNALGAWHHGSASDPGRTSCFCEYCTEKGKKLGIDIERVKKGFRVLEQYIKNGRAGIRPRDGYFVEFWRILLRYPEILVWETLWTDSMHETNKMIYTKIKSIKPEAIAGFHIWQNRAFSPFYKAEQDYRDYIGRADYLKPAMYDNCGAERMTSYVYSAGQNIYGDLNKQQLLEFEYSVMGYNGKSYNQIINGLESYERQLRELPINETPKGNFEKFSSDYILKETKNAVAAVAGSETVIYPGIGIDVRLVNSTPESVRDAVYACFQGGAKGMILYQHAAMKMENLRAVGSTLRELGLG